MMTIRQVIAAALLLAMAGAARAADDPLYDLRVEGVASADGEPLLNTHLVDTANRLRGDKAR